MRTATVIAPTCVHTPRSKRDGGRRCSDCVYSFRLPSEKPASKIPAATATATTAAAAPAACNGYSRANSLFGDTFRPPARASGADVPELNCVQVRIITRLSRHRRRHRRRRYSGSGRFCGPSWYSVVAVRIMTAVATVVVVVVVGGTTVLCLRNLPFHLRFSITSLFFFF